MIGRVSRLWLVVPLLYFGGYYLAYFRNQATLARCARSMPSSTRASRCRSTRRRRIWCSARAGGDPVSQSIRPDYGLARAFDGNGRMSLVGDKEACALLRGNDVYRSAGIYSTGLKSAGDKGPRWGPVEPPDFA